MVSDQTALRGVTTSPEDLDDLNDNTTYMWHYLADKNGVEHEVIDAVADQLAALIEVCPSPQQLRGYIDQWAAQRPDTPATRTQVELVRTVADAMESGKL